MGRHRNRRTEHTWPKTRKWPKKDIMQQIQRKDKKRGAFKTHVENTVIPIRHLIARTKWKGVLIIFGCSLWKPESAWWLFSCASIQWKHKPRN